MRSLRTPFRTNLHERLLYTLLYTYMYQRREFSISHQTLRRWICCEQPSLCLFASLSARRAPVCSSFHPGTEEWGKWAWVHHVCTEDCGSFGTDEKWRCSTSHPGTELPAPGCDLSYRRCLSLLLNVKIPSILYPPPPTPRSKLDQVS